MRLVIDIDEGILQGIIEGKGDEPRNIVRSFQATIADAIKNGTPLPKGEWQDVPMGYYMLLHRCSNCLKRSGMKSKYCPCCGAKMEVEDETGD